MWLNLFIFVISSVLSLIMGPKTAEQTPPSMSDVTAPTAEEGSPIPVVFGTVMMAGPNVVWYGDLSYKQVRSEGGK